MTAPKKVGRRFRVASLIALGFIVAIAMTATPASSHVTGSVTHLVKHMKKYFYTKTQSDARFVNAIPGSNNAPNANKLDGLNSTQFVGAATEGSDDSVTLTGTRDTPNVLNDLDVNAPASGALLVTWNAWTQCSGGETNETWFSLDGADIDFAYIWVLDCSAFGTESFTALLPVTAGAHNIRVLGDDFNGGTHAQTVDDSRLTATFIRFGIKSTGGFGKTPAATATRGSGPGH